MKNIPFNRVGLVGNELNYINQSIANTELAGDGSFTKLCHAFFEENFSIKKSLLTTSCTHALEMSALLLDLKPGDEVIVPSFTFVSTVNAFVMNGAKPVFIDIRDDTLNMNEEKLERLITDKTKAIVVVHYAGVACEMELIMNISKKFGIPVIEDNAHGLFGTYKNKFLGTFGTFSTQSFHETKNFTCGEGGALFINDPHYIDRAQIIREKGTNRSLFLQGVINKYTWVDIGSSYLPSDILAAFLYAQLEENKKIQSNRKKIWNYYYESLSSWAIENGVRLPIVPQHCIQSYHMFYMLMPSLEKRIHLIKYLKDNLINTVFHYLPLHLSNMGIKFGCKKGDCPVTEELSYRIIRLPFYNDLRKNDQDLVIDKIKSAPSI